MITYPVNFIKIIRFHHGGTDNSGTIRSPQLNINTAEEDIEFTLDCGGVSLLRDGELCAERSALNRTRGDIPLVEGR